MATAFIVIIFATLAAEAALSRRHERILRAEGAIEPPHDVYRAMQMAYPACFVALTAEALLRHGAALAAAPAGAMVFGTAKLLKYWAIASLGPRWSFRVLVLPGRPLVTRGPYRYLRHPNYLAVIGELAGTALTLGAPAAGIVSVLGFGVLIARRIAVEERALGLR